MRSIECPLAPLSLKNVSKGPFPCPASQQRRCNKFITSSLISGCMLHHLIHKREKSSETLVWYFSSKDSWIFRIYFWRFYSDGSTFRSPFQLFWELWKAIWGFAVSSIHHVHSNLQCYFYRIAWLPSKEP